MTIELLAEYVTLLIERENDVRYMRAANNSYIEVSKLLYALRGVPATKFNEFVKKVNGRYGVINLEELLPRPEHEGLYLQFVDHGSVGAKKSVTSIANRTLGPESRTYVITIYYDAPHETVKEYNVDFRENVATWFAGAKNREHYVHEFVHVMDYRRMSDEYLQGRAAAKRMNRETGKKKDFAKYMNDPLETNAYMQQSFVAVRNMLKGAKTRAAWHAVMGNTPQEFVERFMTQYLDKRAKKHWDEVNARKAMTRAAQFYETMLETAPVE